MPFELRRPALAPVPIFVGALEERLRAEVPHAGPVRTAPTWLRRLIRRIRLIAQPVLQTGALATVTILMIVTVGIAPAGRNLPAPVNLASPTIQQPAASSAASLEALLPPEEFLATEDLLAMTAAHDMPPLAPE